MTTRRLLVTCLPGYGHFHPLLPLTLAHRDAGWLVLVATGPEMVPEVRRHGLTAVAVGRSVADAEREFYVRNPGFESLPAGQRMRALLADLFVDIGGRSRLPGISKVIEDWRPHRVLHDVLDFAAAPAALRAAVPHIAHGVSVAIPDVAFFTAVERQLEALHRSHGLDDGPRRVRDTTFLDICPPMLGGGIAPYSRVVPLRPCSQPPAPGETLPASLQRLPHERTVVVSLGTVVNAAPGLLEAIVEGAREEPVNLVVTVGPGQDPARLGRQPANVVVEQFLPFGLLLPQCSAVVCHAGAGTLLGALAAGLPLVLTPVGAEQPQNAQRATAAGVALTLSPEQVTPEATRMALHRILHEPAFGANAQQVQQEIAAMPDPASTVASLDEDGRRPSASAAAQAIGGTPF